MHDMQETPTPILSDDPVITKCVRTDGKSFEVLATDIGLHGLSFYVIDSPALPIPGDSLLLTFGTIPGRKVTVATTIKDSSRVLGVVRFEVEFKDVSEDTNLMLKEYLASRQRGITQETSYTMPDEALVFVVDESRALNQYSFLEQRFKVAYSDSFGVIGRLLTALPDVILFGSGFPDALMILQILEEHPVLKEIPVIEVQKEGRNSFQDSPSSLMFPLDEVNVLALIDETIKLRKLSQMLMTGELVAPLQTGISLLLVDDSSVSKADYVQALRDLDCDVKLIEDLKLLYDSFVWNTPDVIAIDEDTREIDAVTVCRLLNMNRELNTVPKVLLSKKRRRMDRMRSGLFSSVVPKSLSAKQFLSNLNQLLAQAPG